MLGSKKVTFLEKPCIRSRGHYFESDTHESWSGQISWTSSKMGLWGHKSDTHESQDVCLDDSRVPVLGKVHFNKKIYFCKMFVTYKIVIQNVKHLWICNLNCLILPNYKFSKTYFQTKRVCRQQFQNWWKRKKVLQTGGKHRGKRKNCLIWAISPFPSVRNFV